MKKLVYAVVMLMMLSSGAKAMPCHPVVVAGTATAATPVLLAMGGAVVLTYLIAENIDPWHALFNVVDGIYPDQVHHNGV